DSAPRRLWDAALYELHKRLMAAVDTLNIKFGKDTVRCGLFPKSGAWRTRFERRSPAYTTAWRQLKTPHLDPPSPAQRTMAETDTEFVTLRITYSVGIPAMLSIGFRTIRMPSHADNAPASRAIMICNHQ